MTMVFYQVYIANPNTELLLFLVLSIMELKEKYQNLASDDSDICGIDFSRIQLLQN